MDCQDWNDYKVGVKARGSASDVKRPAITPAMKTARALEDAEEPVLPTKTLGAEGRALLVSKRVELKKTQAELNAMCSFPAHTIRDIESGKLCPTPAQLNVLNRVLRMTLKYA